MRWSSVIAALTLLVLVAATPAAGQGRTCGDLRRPFTDARVAVTVTKGSVSCRTARAVLLRYWRSSPAAASRTRTITYREKRWRCVPSEAMSGAATWGCSTARQRTIVAAVEVG